MSMFSKKDATPDPVVTYKRLGSHYTVDHDALTVTFNKFSTTSARYDISGQELVIPAEWIDHVESKKAMALFFLVNHGSMPIPSSSSPDLWAPVTSKKTAQEMAEDISVTAVRARAQYPARRPFVVPQPDSVKLAQVQKARSKEFPAAVQFGTMMLLDGVVYYGGYALPASGSTASIDAGAAGQSQVGAGRVIGGALLAGPVGALVGAAAKKNTGSIYVTVQSEDGQSIVAAGPSKESGAAMALVNAINAT